MPRSQRATLQKMRKMARELAVQPGKGLLLSSGLEWPWEVEEETFELHGPCPHRTWEVPSLRGTRKEGNRRLQAG